MNILIVSVEEIKDNDRYKDEKGYSFRKAFENLGIKTSTFFFRKKGGLAFLEKERLTKRFWINYINKALLREVKRKKPDILLLLKADTILPETIYTIRKECDTLVINVFPDNPLYMGKFEAILPCHLFFTKDTYVVETVRKTGYKNIHFMPQCTDPDVHRPISADDPAYSPEISLVGSMYPYRLEFLRNLAEFDVKIWGKGWNKAPEPLIKNYIGGDIRGDKKAMVFSNSKISLNPHHPLNDIHGVNRRTYDICACKGFQIADFKEDMKYSYEIDEEIVCFRTPSELKDKICYYLNHLDESRKIAEKAYKKTLEKHTYSHRALEILDYVKNYR